MAGKKLPNALQQFLDMNGDPLIGGFVYHYVPGTTTPLTTYMDVNMTLPNQNPIPLPSGGFASIWLAANTQVRQVVTDVNGNEIWDQVTST